MRLALAAKPAVASQTLATPAFLLSARQMSTEPAYFLDPKDVTSRILTTVRKFEKITDKSKVTPTSHFTKDLGLDSLDGVEVVLALEDEFSVEIPDAEAEKLHSVPDCVKCTSLSCLRVGMLGGMSSFHSLSLPILLSVLALHLALPPELPSLTGVSIVCSFVLSPADISTNPTAK